MKFLRVTMSDKTIWDIPATHIAEARASYFAERDEDTTYEDEFNYTLSDNSELLDWASNNMNWEDVEAVAVRVEEPDYDDYSDDWSGADMEVIEL